MNKKFELVHDVLSKEDLEALLADAHALAYRPCPNWLGYFKFKIYDLTKLNSDEIPKSFLNVAKKALPHVKTDQPFNTIFIQKYEEGNKVHPHYDPRNNKGYTVIIPFGEFEGGVNIVEGEKVKVEPGDILIQQCTIGYSVGPKHSVTEITKGTRYALIFNTIIKEKDS